MNTNKIFLSWLAGFIDGDGCIFITLKKQITRNPYLAVNAAISINQRSDYKWILEYVQKNIGCGKIYLSGNYGTAKSKAYWQTTTMGDTIAVLEKVLPYLVIKKEQAKKTIQCLKYWMSSKQNFKDRAMGLKVRKRADVLKIVDVATHLNSNMRGSTRYRGYKDYNYWKPLIEQWYAE
jgi:hypothetical protein